MFKFCLIFFFHVEKGGVCFLPEKKNKEMKLVPYITIILYRNVYDGSIIIQNKVASAFSACAFKGKKLYSKIWRWEIELEIRFSWSVNLECQLQNKLIKSHKLDSTERQVRLSKHNLMKKQTKQNVYLAKIE